MGKDNKKENEKYIKDIAPRVKDIIDEVRKDLLKKENWMVALEECGIKILPTSLQIAEYYGIKIEYKKIEGNIPSFFNREEMTITISDEYINDRYITSKIVAHELGHFFFDDSDLAALNDDDLNIHLQNEEMKEYRANVFAILVMKQIMRDKPWMNFSPKILNNRVYRSILEK